MDISVDVIGVGGAGGFLASSLYHGGLPPRILSRGKALQHLRDVGLTILSGNKQEVYTPAQIKSQALEDVRQFAPVIFLTTKSYDIPALLEEIAPRITAQTLLVSLQNGFAAYDAISSTFGPERSAMGVLYVSASIVSPGVIDIKPGVAQLFLPEQHTTVLSPIVDALTRAGTESRLVNDIEKVMWVKQLFLVPFAIVNAEMHEPIGKLRENPQARARWIALTEEIIAIATACGIPLPPDTLAQSMAKAEQFDPQANSSFARDVWASRPHEAEALIGPLLRRAYEYTVPCPLLEQAYHYYVK